MSIILRKKHFALFFNLRYKYTSYHLIIYLLSGGYGTAAAGQYPTAAAGNVVPQVTATAAYPTAGGAQATAVPQAGAVGAQSYAFNRPPPTGIKIFKRSYFISNGLSERVGYYLSGYFTF